MTCVSIKCYKDTNNFTQSNFFCPQSVVRIYLFEISYGEYICITTLYAIKRKPLRGRDIPHALHDSAGAP